MLVEYRACSTDRASIRDTTMWAAAAFRASVLALLVKKTSGARQIIFSLILLVRKKKP